MNTYVFRNRTTEILVDATCETEAREYLTERIINIAVNLRTYLPDAKEFEMVDSWTVMNFNTSRPGDEAAILAEETGIDYARALVMCNMD